MGSQFRNDRVQGAPRFADDILDRRLAFGDGGHPLFEVPSHLGARDVGTVSGEGVHERTTSRGGAHRSPGDELTAEEEIEDLVPSRFRAEVETLHREEEGPLRMERRRLRPVLHDPQLRDWDRFALCEGR
jgi:hypothetical protein